MPWRFKSSRHALIGAVIAGVGLWGGALLLMSLAWQRYDALQSQTQQSTADLQGQSATLQALTETWHTTQRNEAAFKALVAQNVVGPLAKQAALDQLEASLQQPGITVSGYNLAAEAPVKDPANVTLQSHEFMRHRISLEGLARHEGWLVELINQVAAHQAVGLSTLEFCALRRDNKTKAGLSASPEHNETSANPQPLVWRCTLNWYRFAARSGAAEDAR